MSIRQQKIDAFVAWSGTIPVGQNITHHPMYKSYTGDFTSEELAAAIRELRRIAEAEIAEADALEREGYAANDDDQAGVSGGL